MVGLRLALWDVIQAYGVTRVLENSLIAAADPHTLVPIGGQGPIAV